MKKLFIWLSTRTEVDVEAIGLDVSGLRLTRDINLIKDITGDAFPKWLLSSQSPGKPYLKSQSALS